MRLVRTGLLLALACQGLYWLGVVLERGDEPLSLLGMVLAQGYMVPLMAMTALGLALALWGAVSEARRRRTPG
jgi:hypothetical protein